MDPLWLLLLLPTAAAGGWVMAKRERHAAAPRLPEAYFKGLSFLLNEQPDKALRVFLEAVKVDGETIEMHLALGNLFRRRGEIERATRIHQNLVARSDLEQGLRTLALFELAQDYFKAGLFDRAENLFQELREVAEHREQANRFLLQIYEREKEWHNAILTAEELAQITDTDLSKSLAQYGCELAEKALTEGRFDPAAAHLTAALRHDPRCVRAVIQSGRLESMRGRHQAAIALWRKLENWAPEALGEVVDHIANSSHALGDAAIYQRFLRAAIARNPDPRILTALVETTRQNTPNAGDPLLELVRAHPSLEGLCELIKSRAGTTSGSRDKKDFAILADLLTQLLGDQRAYHCNTCGFASGALHWQCPGCKSWGTVLRGNKAPRQPRLAM